MQSARLFFFRFKHFTFIMQLSLPSWFGAELYSFIDNVLCFGIVLFVFQFPLRIETVFFSGSVVLMKTLFHVLVAGANFLNT